MSFDNFSLFKIPSETSAFSFPGLPRGPEIYIKRDDLIHPEVQGNKWRKLQENIRHASLQNKSHIVTMGGPWSNHLAATASACALLGFTSEALVRGKFSDAHFTQTLRFCQMKGMKLNMLEKHEYDFLKTNEAAGSNKMAFFIPEGGANMNGLTGCMKIRNEIPFDFNYIAAPVGTGTTCAGLALSCKLNEKVLCINVFKTADRLREMIEEKIKWMVHEKNRANEIMNRLHIIDGFSFGGFARINTELIEFRQRIYKECGIDTDLVYTAKMFYAIKSLAQQGFFKNNEKIVLLHTGGLQGNDCFQHKESKHS